jgi:hypothetical protein
MVAFSKSCFVKHIYRALTNDMGTSATSLVTCQSKGISSCVTSKASRLPGKMISDLSSSRLLHLHSLEMKQQRKMKMTICKTMELSEQDPDHLLTKE